MKIIEDKSKNFIYEIDVFDLLKQLWIAKFYIILLVIISFIFSLFYLRNQPQIYNVGFSVIPTSKNLESGQSNDTSLSGLINLSLGNNSKNASDDFSLYLTSFKSRVTAYEISKDLDLMKKIFKNEWNDNTNNWITVKPSNLQQLKNYVKEFLNFPISVYQKPNVERVELLLRKITIHANVSGDTNTAINYINIKTSRPDLWIDLFEKIHNATEGFLRARDLKRTDEYISFLNSSISSTNNLAQREALIRGLAVQLKNKMIASADIPYAAEIFSSPYPSPKPVSPRLTQTVLIFVISAFIFGCLGTFLYFFIYRKIRKIN